MGIHVADTSLGTLIAGSPRSGTTLALKVLCSDLRPEETLVGGSHNEPPTFWDWCIHRNDSTRNIAAEVNLILPELLKQSRHGIVKAPHAISVLGVLALKYRVILTFRDIRLVVASMLNHAPSVRLGLSATPYWRGLIDDPSVIEPMTLVQRALLYAKTFMLHGLDYRGKLELWNYGFWDEWKCNAMTLRDLYQSAVETSKRVRDDVIDNDAIFSNASFTLDAWNEAREVHKISDAEDAEVRATNDRIVRLYRERGLEAKTLDDIGDSVPIERALTRLGRVSNDAIAELRKSEPEMQLVQGLMRKCELMTVARIAQDCDLFISIGCGTHGFDMRLAREQSTSLRIVGFDRLPPSQDFQDLRIEHHVVNVFDWETREEISKLVKSHGRCLVYCDNGNKIRELHMVRGLLKPDDVLGVHDYPIEVPEDSTGFLDEDGYVLYEKVEPWIEDHLCRQRFWIKG